MKTIKWLLSISYLLTFFGIWLVGGVFASGIYYSYTGTFPEKFIDETGETYDPISGFGTVLCFVLGGLFVHLPIFTNLLSLYCTSKMRDCKMRTFLRVSACLGTIICMFLIPLCLFGSLSPDKDNQFYGMYSGMVGIFVSVLLFLSLIGLLVSLIIRHKYRTQQTDVTHVV